MWIPRHKLTNSKMYEQPQRKIQHNKSQSYRKTVKQDETDGARQVNRNQEKLKRTKLMGRRDKPITGRYELEKRKTE